jgi:hypothetical protein
MKQTAVEWLIGQLPLIQQEGLRDIWEQAKAMEKEQIMGARINGDLNGLCIAKLAIEGSEQYYNKTFKSE